jgi:transcription initiation factor TFIIF subunit beta
MKAFRQQLQQPEAYLRETLEKVAILHKSGPFSTQWSLKPENRLTNYEDKGETAAPIMEGAEEDDDGGEGDDDDEQFVDAL